MISFLLVSAGFVAAQDEEQAPTRSISSMDFQTQRPKTAKKVIKNNPQNQRRRKNIEVLTDPQRRYNFLKRVPRAAKTKAGANVSKTAKTKLPPLRDEKVGITFWRLREPKSHERDDAPTFPVKTDEGIEYWTAERASSDDKFKEGNHVRFTIESPRSGYLYVVNREYYTDGSRGEARLIFPTTKTRRGGDNKVTVGELVELPDSKSRIPYFTVRSKAPDYAGEEIIILISPKPLLEFKIGENPLPVTTAKLEKWLTDWATTIDIFEADDGKGVALTQTEQESVTAVQTRALTQEEPSPQTIFNVKARAGQPLLIVFQMQAKD